MVKKQKEDKLDKRQSERYQGLMPLSMSVKPLVNDCLPKKMSVLGRLLSDWTTIMKGLPAENALPHKMSKGKSHTKKTLVLAVNSGDAMAVEYAKRQILDRINGFLGENLIENIQIKQTELKITRNDMPLDGEYRNANLKQEDDTPKDLETQLDDFWQAVKEKQTKQRTQ